MTQQPEATSWDLVVVGAGPGGYVAAIRGAQKGLRTALVEEQHLGGVCLNWGCIPTKALLKSADLLEEVKHAESMGIRLKGDAVEADLQAMVARSRQVSSTLSKGVRHLMKKHKVTVLEGRGRWASPQHITVTPPGGKTTTHTAPAIILATGARPRVLPGLEPDGRVVWTSREAMTPDTLPRTLLVVGSGAIGMEFASFYHRLGTKVQVLEVQGRILPPVDEEIARMAREAFESQGMVFHTGATLQSLERMPHDKGARVAMHTGGQTRTLEVERVIMATGITPNTEDLGLEKSRVRLDRGHVVTGPFSQTDEPGLYAIGDMASPPWLAHKASHEAIACVDAIAHPEKKKGHGLNPRHIPACIYTSPQIAQIGLTEAEALAAGHSFKVGRFPFAGNGKAVASGLNHGLVKTLFDAETGALLGAHMLGHGVTELVHSMALAMTLEATEEDLMHTVFPHPTLSEMLHESTLQAFDQAIHI